MFATDIAFMIFQYMVADWYSVYDNTNKLLLIDAKWLHWPFLQSLISLMHVKVW